MEKAVEKVEKVKVKVKGTINQYGAIVSSLDLRYRRLRIRSVTSGTGPVEREQLIVALDKCQQVK